MCAGVAILVAVSAASAGAAETIAPTFDDVEPRESAAATFTANAFEIVHLGSSGVINEKGSSWRPVRGLVYRVSIGRDVFFDVLGRADLAEAYLSRRRTAGLIEMLGYTSATAGVFVTFIGFGESTTWGLVGLSMLVGGVITRELGRGLRQPTFPEDQARDMAARYNEALRARLGLPPVRDEPRPPPAATGGGTVTLAPFLLRGGAGLGARGRF
jgi:hypothetical protein